MKQLLDYMISDWPFLLALLLLMYLLYIRPSIHEKRRIKNPDNEIRVGDFVAKHNGIAGKIVYLSETKIIIESGRNRQRFSFTLDELDTNFSAIKRNKDTWNRLSLWKKILRKV